MSSITTTASKYHVIIDTMDGLRDGEVRIAPHIRVLDARAAAWTWLVDLVAAADVASTIPPGKRKDNWLILSAREWMDHLKAVGIWVHIEVR